MNRSNADDADDAENQCFSVLGYPHSELSARIIAVAQEVHRTLGPGFKEVFYQRARSKELQADG